jgi:hypothetical protein
LLVVVCAPAIADAAGVFVATVVARGGSTVVAAAAAAMPASIAAAAALLPQPLLPALTATVLLPMTLRCRQAAKLAATATLPRPPPPPPPLPTRC